MDHKLKEFRKYWHYFVFNIIFASLALCVLPLLAFLSLNVQVAFGLTHLIFAALIRPSTVTN
jgi:hypothetical protein